MTRPRNPPWALGQCSQSRMSFCDLLLSAWPYTSGPSYVCVHSFIWTSVPQLESGPNSNWALGCPPIPTIPITLRFGLHNEIHFPHIFFPACLSLTFDLVHHLSGLVLGLTHWFSPYQVPRKLLHQRVDIWGWALGLEPSPSDSRPFLSTLHPFLQP